MSEQQADALSRNPLVRWIEDDVSGSVTGTQTPTPSWGLDRIDQRLLPLDNTYNYAFTGSGVIAYLVDTGVTIRTDFGGRVIDRENFVSFNDQAPNPYDDCYGHGTQVAGIVGGTTYGVAKNVGLISVRVYPCQGWQPQVTDWIAGIDWATGDFLNRRNANPNCAQFGSGCQQAVMNISLSAAAINTSLDTAVINAIGDGITVVVGAGNNRQDACLESPAHLGNPTGANAYSPNPNGYSTITVGATTQADHRWDWGYPGAGSNFGQCVDIFAPGENVTTLSSTDNGVTFSGTSAAAPHVTGGAALFMEQNASATPALPAASIEGIIKDNATANVLNSDIQPGSPNLLLYNHIVRHRGCCTAQ